MNVVIIREEGVLQRKTLSTHFDITSALDSLMHIAMVAPHLPLVPLTFDVKYKNGPVLFHLYIDAANKVTALGSGDNGVVKNFPDIVAEASLCLNYKARAPWQNTWKDLEWQVDTHATLKPPVPTRLPQL